jgi:WS/DGAT/MGAT family acyltransferase
VERVRGADAIFLHLEHPGTPVHTLKVLVLDPARRGRPITLGELRSAVATRLGHLPRAAQRVVYAPGFGGRPFWAATSVDLTHHVDERTASSPGDRRRLDALCSSLAAEPLDMERPLWAMTLVHGLARGRQAIVIRIHHAVTDGLGALNAFLAVTTAEPGPPVEPASGPRSEHPTPASLTAAAAAEVRPWLSGLRDLGRDAVASRRRASDFRSSTPDLPPVLGARRTLFNTSSGGRRVCASKALALTDLRRVSKQTGVTVNGVLHAVLAGAVRAELVERGAPAEQPTVAAFGIAGDPKGATRRHGNNVAVTNVALFSHLADPVDRLRETARSCREGVELRRQTGLDMAVRWSDYTCRLAPAFQRALADRAPVVVNHVTTANVAGPDRTRWLGDIEVVDWISFAIAVNPSNLNVTCYSYAGRMNVGLVSTPEALPHPDRFLERMRASLDELVEVTSEGLLAQATP